jgi:hypothetical protein
MGIGLVRDEGSVFIEKEITEGEYVAESASSSAVEVLSDGLEFTPTKELLERNNRTSTVEQVPSRVGQKSMSGTIPVEFRSGSSEGSEPETSPLYEAMLGGKRNYVSKISDIGHTTTRIQLADGDAAQYSIGDIVKVKEYDQDPLNEDHISPIVSKSEALGDNYIELLIPYKQAFSDGVEISAGVTYFHQSGAPTLSITNYIGGEIREKAIGMRPVSAELSNFSTGQLPQISFGVEGLNFDREVGQPLFSPSYDTSLPPVVLCAKIFQNSNELIVNEVSISMANTLGFLTSTASCNGKISSRITDFSVNFSANPYMENDDVDQYNLFDKNEKYSMFGFASNYGALSEDEKLEGVSFYMPNCRSTELATGDQDGIVTDAITGSAFRENGNDTIFISFI